MRIDGYTQKPTVEKGSIPLKHNFSRDNDTRRLGKTSRETAHESEAILPITSETPREKETTGGRAE